MAVATLTIAIGAASSLYAFLRASLASQTPQIENIDAVARICASNRGLGVERGALSLLDFESGVSKASSFGSVAAHRSDESKIVLGAAPETISVGQVTETFFEVFRVWPASGRLIRGDDVRRRDPVMVVSDSLWRRHFGGRDPGEATLMMDGMTWNIVGVLPASFGFPFLGINPDAWTWMQTPAEATSGSVSVVARLRREASWKAASAELDALARAHISSNEWTWQAIPVRSEARKAGTVRYCLPRRVRSSRS